MKRIRPDYRPCPSLRNFSARGIISFISLYSLSSAPDRSAGKLFPALSQNTGEIPGMVERTDSTSLRRQGRGLAYRATRAFSGIIGPGAFRIRIPANKGIAVRDFRPGARPHTDRKSTRLNSSHLVISYAVFC